MVQILNILKCLINQNTSFFDSELYVNSRLSSSFYVKEDIKTYYVKSNKTNALISLNQIEKAINAHDCKTLQDLSNYFNLPTTHLFLTM